MATFVQGVDGQGVFNTGQTFAMPGNSTSGNTICVIMEHSYLGCPPSITDTLGNTYTSKGANPSPVAGRFLFVFTAPVTSTGANTLTITFSCGNSFAFFAAEVSGLVTDPFDDEATLDDTTTAYGPGNLTPTQNNDFIMALWHKQGSDLGGSSVASPMNFFTNALKYATAYGIQATTSDINPELTGPANTITCYGAAFKATATGGDSQKAAFIRLGRFSRQRPIGLRTGMSSPLALNGGIPEGSVGTGISLYRIYGPWLK